MVKFISFILDDQFFAAYMMKKILEFDNKIFKIGISVLASLYIVFHGRKINLLESLQEPVFYIAFSVSFLVALLMINLIDYAHKWLDSRHDWVLETARRSVAQVTLCIALPLLIDFVLLSVYFYFLGTNIFDNGFLKHDFPLIVCFVLLINMYYIIKSLFEEKVYQAYPGKTDNNISTNDDILTISHNGVVATFLVKNEILYFYREQRKVYLFTKKGKEYAFGNMTITELEQQYKEIDFYKIKRNVIVNCDAIQGYSTTLKRDNFRLILKRKYDVILPDKNTEHFLFSREHLPFFKDRFIKI